MICHKISEILQGLQKFFKQRRLDDFWASVPYDLFLHAAEDEGRTEEPTERRKAKAREEEGRVFMTQELPQAAVVLAVSTVIFLSGRFVLENIHGMFVEFIENPARLTLAPGELGYVFQRSLTAFAKIFIPVGGVALFTVIVTSLVQTQGLFTTKNFKLNFNKMVPSLENLKNRTIFSRTQLLNVVKIFVKMSAIIAISAFFIMSHLDQIRSIIGMPLFEAGSLISRLLYTEVVIVSIFLLILAIPDWFIQKHEYTEQLKMKKQDIQEEMKEMEGDPVVKQRQRKRAQEILSRAAMVKNSAEADVIITNPTHYSCAVKWDPELSEDPKLTAKGVDGLALRMREEARKHGVKIQENRPLARALYDTVEVNDYIPAKFFNPLVEIYRTLEKFKKMSEAA